MRSVLTVEGGHITVRVMCQERLDGQSTPHLHYMPWHQMQKEGASAATRSRIMEHVEYAT